MTFAAYRSGTSPIISGSDPVGGWALYSGAIYEAPLTTSPGNVYADGGPGWGLTHACGLPGSSSTVRGSCAIGPMQPGSWYWDGGSKLYVWLADGSDPSAHLIEAAVRTYGMNVTAEGGEKGYIVVDGLSSVPAATVSTSIRVQLAESDPQAS